MKEQTKICTTERFAKLNLVKPQTVLKRHCETGSYFGAIPRKLANGRLAWPLPESENDMEKVK